MTTTDRSDETLRRNASPLQLLRQTMGGPATFLPKLARLASVISRYGGREMDERLRLLAQRGTIAAIPTRAQLVVGSIDMLRFWISPAAADYYEQQGISYAFHQLLRFLDEPASLADPVGLMSTRDGIIGHLMQVVHANPVYDLQLLQMFPDGIDQLLAQLDQMLAGVHPRHAAISAIVEETDYHQRLRDFTARWRAAPDTPPLLRSNIEAGRYGEAEKIFGTLTGSMAYFCRLPRDLPGAVRHLLTVRQLPDGA